MLCRMLKRSSCWASLVNTGWPSVATLLQHTAGYLEARVLDRPLIDAARHAKREPVPGLVEHHEAALGVHRGDHLVHDPVEHLIQVQGRVEGLRQMSQQRQRSVAESPGSAPAIGLRTVV